ncbi:MAG: endonuclease NucS [Candidatus Thermoplasmatota archaeon]
MNQINTLNNPSVNDALQFIRYNHLSKPDRTTLLLIGDCIVDYQGRAKSLLDWGERIVIVKQDGAVLVHQPVMREPVNWQPSGSITRFSLRDNLLVLHSHHTKPAERMSILFRSLKTVTIAPLVDNAKMILSGMETDVVNNILLNPGLIEEGIRITKKEKHVKSGYIDLYGYDKNHTPVVIEVKRSVASISSVHQLRVYVNEIKKNRQEAVVRGILCAPRVPDMIKKLLEEYGLEWREVERKIILPVSNQKTLKEFLS